MKLIAIEEHFLTPDIRAAWASSAIGTEGTAAFDRGEIEARLDDLGPERIACMDEGGVDVQVLSVTTPALHNLEPAESVTLARRTNDLIAATIAKHPARFQGLATLPTPSPADAARELGRAVQELGLTGAMLCGRTRDRNMDHPDFLPVYETAFATFALGWHYEAGIQFVRLMLAGVFDRYPDLQIILGHWGEVVLFYLERLGSLARVARLERPVVDYVHQNLYVTPSGMWIQSYLQRTLEIVGPERILFSTDYPYRYRPGAPGRAFVQESPLSGEQKELFAHGNWERLTWQAVPG